MVLIVRGNSSRFIPPELTACTGAANALIGEPTTGLQNDIGTSRADCELASGNSWTSTLQGRGERFFVRLVEGSDFKRFINPKGAQCKLFYPGSGADIAGPLKFTDASTLVFADLDDDTSSILSALKRDPLAENVRGWESLGAGKSRLTFRYEGKSREIFLYTTSLYSNLPDEIVDGYDVLFLKASAFLCFNDDRNFDRLVGPLKNGGHILKSYHPANPDPFDKRHFKYGLLKIARSRSYVAREMHYHIWKKLYTATPTGWLSEQYLIEHVASSDHPFMTGLIKDLTVLNQLVTSDYKLPKKDFERRDMTDEQRRNWARNSVSHIVNSTGVVMNALISLYSRRKLHKYARVIPFPESQTFELAERLFISAHPKGEEAFKAWSTMYRRISEWREEN